MSSITSTSTTATTATTSSLASNFLDIHESSAFVITDDSSSIESSSSTASLSPSSSSSPNNESEFISLRKRITSKLTTKSSTKRRVTFGLHHNVTKLIEPYTDNWLTKAELRAIRCGGLSDIESNKIYFQGYLQSVDAATIHMKYSKEFQPKGQRGSVKADDSQKQKVLMDTLTRVLITGCNLGFRGLEHGSKDARHRRTGRSLTTAAIVSNHRLLFTIHKSALSLTSKESQFRKFCEGLSYNSRMWAYYMAMIDATAAMQEYATIPQSLLQYKTVITNVPKVVVVPCGSSKHSTTSTTTIMKRILPTIQLLQSDHISRRGYHRLSPHENEEGSFPLLLEDEPIICSTNRPRHSSRSKTTKTLFRKAMQRLKP